MKKTKRFDAFFLILLFLLSITITACDKDWLDKKPNKNLTILTSLNDYEALMDGFGAYYSPLTLGDIASDDHFISEANWITGQPDFKVNAYTWTNLRPNLAVPYWDNPYTTVLYSNLVLEGLSKLDPQTNAEVLQYNRIRGNALFHRARIFFEIAQLWTSPLENSISDSEFGIPIRLESDINIPTKRSTIKQTYDQIFKDLDEAKSLLPAVPSIKVRASKLSVYAQLARIYVTLENYELAASYADSSLMIHNKLLDYNKLNTNVNFIGALNEEVILHSYQSEASRVPSENQIDLDLYNSYNANDLRKTIFFTKNANGSVVFKGNYYNSSNQLFTGLATDEIYLIRSECYARKGQTINAMNDLNYLLQSRWKNTVPYVNLTANNAEEALLIILKERRKELLLRGIRWLDLRRLNKDDRFKKTITHSAGGQTWTLEPNSYKYTFPIPDDVLQYSGIKQNKGWEK